MKVLNYKHETKLKEGIEVHRLSCLRRSRNRHPEECRILQESLKAFVHECETKQLKLTADK